MSSGDSESFETELSRSLFTHDSIIPDSDEEPNSYKRKGRQIISSSSSSGSEEEEVRNKQVKPIISSSDEEENYSSKPTRPLIPSSSDEEIDSSRQAELAISSSSSVKEFPRRARNLSPIYDGEKEINSLDKSELLSSTRLEHSNDDIIHLIDDIIDASDEFYSNRTTLPLQKNQNQNEGASISKNKSQIPVDFHTPRKVKQISLSESEKSDEESEVVISDDESDGPEVTPPTVKKQPLQDLTQKMGEMKTIPLLQTGLNRKIDEAKTNFKEVSPREYQEQLEKTRRIQSDFQRASDLLKKINLNQLPDKGVALKQRAQILESAHLAEVKKLSEMKTAKQVEPPKVLSWDQIEAGATKVVPKTFGKQAMATVAAERQLTIERLQMLHGSLQTCPKESDLAEPPRGLKVELMVHQKRALLWLMWREKQKPSGGILADDMGLGKTLTMISLMLKCNEIEKDNDDSDEEEENAPRRTKYNGGTLVVCPASLINQWSGELERRTKRGLASCEIYHGAKRENRPRTLAKYDMVVTTYSIVNNECYKNGAIFQVKWRRIVIDEAHQIRNYKSQTSEAVCKLKAKSRWALTGTPIHNKELDMFALLKFLKCAPFDEVAVWKRWVADKGAGGSERLHTVISSLMLRRTKAELISKGSLSALPERKWELMRVELAENERGVYSKILIFSRTLFAQFLHQRAEKNQDHLMDQNYNLNVQKYNDPNQEYVLMRQKLLKLNKLREIKGHEILVLLLRLRQICNHPSLITGMLQEDGNAELLGDDGEQADRASALDLLDQLNKLNLNDVDQSTTSTSVAAGIAEEAPGLSDVAKSVLNPSDPVFSKTRVSSKVKVLLDLLREKVITTDDKAIIVSQWSSFLHLIAYHLREAGFKYDQLDGQVPVPKRMEMVDRFNNPKDKMKILLLSLTAGGVGLNLVGANHLILLDLHWNPQLENQAQDRIYRVGQEKPVFIYKFLATETIEQRILDLQQKKLDMADSMLTGSSQANRNKLSLQDLKMLFEM